MDFLKQALSEFNFNFSSFYRVLELTHCLDEPLQASFQSVDEAKIWLKTVTQAHWLRKQGVERWDQDDTAFMQEHREEFLRLFDQLGLISEQKPKHKTYDIALLLGALQSDFEIRIDYLSKLWNQGVRFNQLVVLGGQFRPLIPGKETIFFEGATELDMMNAIVDDRRTTWPQDLQGIEILIVDNLVKKNPHKVFTKRQNTFDTIQEWLTYQPKPGAILAISNQPYIDYQQAVIHSALPNTFKLETVGEKVEEDVRISTILDSLARRIYVLSQ